MTQDSKLETILASMMDGVMYRIKYFMLGSEYYFGIYSKDDFLGIRPKYISGGFSSEAGMKAVLETTMIMIDNRPTTNNTGATL